MFRNAILRKISKLWLAFSGKGVFSLPRFLQKSIFEKAVRDGHFEQVKMMKDFKKQFSKN